MRITIIRHGESVSNREGVFCSCKENLPLSVNGVNHIKTLKKCLDGMSIDTVFVSPLKRALQTADIIFGKNYQVLPDLIEIDYGQFEGQSIAEYQKMYDSIFKRWDSGCELSGFPEGESYRSVNERCSRVMERIGQSGAQHICLISHGAFSTFFIWRVLFLKRKSVFKFKFARGQYRTYKQNGKGFWEEDKID